MFLGGVELRRRGSWCVPLVSAARERGDAAGFVVPEYFGRGRSVGRAPRALQPFVINWHQNQQAGEDGPRRLIERRYKMPERLVFLSLMIVILTAKVKIVVSIIVKKR
jgi:hypothetical protein